MTGEAIDRCLNLPNLIIKLVDDSLLILQLCLSFIVLGRGLEQVAQLLRSMLIDRLEQFLSNIIKLHSHELSELTANLLDDLLAQLID